jgi:hypothetical protein
VTTKLYRLTNINLYNVIHFNRYTMEGWTIIIYSLRLLHGKNEIRFFSPLPYIYIYIFFWIMFKKGKWRGCRGRGTRGKAYTLLKKKRPSFISSVQSSRCR